MGYGARQDRSAGGAAVLALLTLWAFAAVTTAVDVADLFRQRSLGDGLGQPTDAVITALQDERRGSVRFLADGAPARPELDRQRERTDAAVAELRRRAGGWSARLAASDAVRRSADDLTTRLDALRDLRAGVDDRGVDRAAAADRYTTLIDAAFGVYRSAWTRRDGDLAAEGRAFVALLRAREQLAREDTLASGAFASGRLTAAEQLRFVELRAQQRLLLAEAAAQLPAADRAAYTALATGPKGAALASIEDRVASTGSTGADPAGEAAAWQSAAGPVLTAQRVLIADGVRASVDRATPGAVWTIVRLGLFGGLGLVAVLVAAAAWRRTRRAGPAEGVPPAATGQPDVLLALELRNQVLARRQLDLLEAMQRRETGVDELADLFTADHLATRLRRNVEKAITLAGSDPGRRWRRPVPLLDVARAAAAEIEEYQRVTVGPIADADLAGPAVTDTVHLLAELIENAVAASPGTAPVRVTGGPSGAGYAIEVTDAGPGLDGTRLAVLNDLVRQPGTPPVTGQRQGLYVVARLAQRRGLEVDFLPATEGGTTARLLVPPALLPRPPSGDPASLAGHDPAPPASRDPASMVGRDLGPAVGRDPGLPAARDPASAVGRDPGLPVGRDLGVPPGRDPASVVGRDPGPTAGETTYAGPAEQPAAGPETENGLPIRVPRPRSAVPAGDDDDEPPRPPPSARRSRAPEDVRRRLDAYRAQTLRGRGQTADAETAEIPVNWADPAGREDR
ncbi:sensor histidine kinase [Rhizomonospora bruguierae]|uniref:sensor histidine kinase n=1 Tax=Rhizomonospora bruguierae TaxID=1581705 RepID=UPI001BCB6090|nr:nitrate- and nitrite sensing domain-containing protein [Micromonospora sp. NBRC 107566]